LNRDRAEAKEQLRSGSDDRHINANELVFKLMYHTVAAGFRRDCLAVYPWRL
jgi:hypothetical protein